MQPVHDAEVAALHRGLEDLQQRIEHWMTSAVTLLASRSQQLADIADGLEALARDARQHVREVTLPDVDATPQPVQPTQSAPSTEAAASAAAPADDLGLDELWNAMRPVALDRLRIVVGACDAARNGGLDDEQRGTAIEAARQLMGSLGGYGKLEGSAAAARAAHLLGAGEVPVGLLDSALHDLALSIDPAGRGAVAR